MPANIIFNSWPETAREVVISSNDGVVISCWAPVPNGVLKCGPTNMIKWEASIYEVLQLHGYPRILLAYHEIENGRATLCMRHLVPADWLLLLEINYSVYWSTVCTDDYHKSVAKLIADLVDMLAEIHRLGVLHGDIHPSNVGWLLQHGGSGSSAVFFDFGRAYHNGHGPSAFPSLPENDYTPARMLAREPDEQPAYMARDDLESLAYTALALLKCGHNPWAMNNELDSPTSAKALEQREWALGHWEQAKGRPLHRVDEVALEFTKYAIALEPGAKIAYRYWAARFRQLADVPPSVMASVLPAVKNWSHSVFRALVGRLRGRI